MARKSNRKFSKVSQARETFARTLSDVLVRKSAGGTTLSSVCLRKVVRESLPDGTSRSTVSRRVAAIAVDPYFRRRMEFIFVGRTWYVKLKDCLENARWIRCLLDRIAGTWKPHRELSSKDIRLLIRAMNYAYSEIAAERKKKDANFDPRYDGISLIKIVRRAELREKIDLDRANGGRIMAIFKSNCAKRYIFAGNNVRLPMSESKRARAIMRVAGKNRVSKNEEIDVTLFNRVKQELIVSAKYIYANERLFDPFYDTLPVRDVLNKVLNWNSIELNCRQMQRWIRWMAGDKYLSLFFEFSKKCVLNGTKGYKSSCYILRLKSNQRKLRTDIFMLQKRFSRAQEEREEREIMSNSQTKRHISLRSKDSLYSLGFSTPGAKMSTSAKTLVRHPGDPPEEVENPFEFGASKGGSWPPSGQDVPQFGGLGVPDGCRLSCADMANSRLSDLDVWVMAASSRRFREKLARNRNLGTALGFDLLPP
jgi:hypothetical protein